MNTKVDVPLFPSACVTSLIENVGGVWTVTVLLVASFVYVSLEKKRRLHVYPFVGGAVNVTLPLATPLVGGVVELFARYLKAVYEASAFDVGQ